MKDVRFQGFAYQTGDSLPEGVVFFGTDGKGTFHQMTRNAEPSPENVDLPEAVGETIALAKELAEQGTSVGFKTPSYLVADGHWYARSESMLTSAGGLSFASNVFFFDEERYLVQIQCGSLLTTPKSALSARKQLMDRLNKMIDSVVASGF